MRLTPALALLALTGCAEPTVVRIVDGREVEGRFISGYAYALYARAAEVEATGGDPALTLSILHAAAHEDPKSPELWTKIGALECRTLDTASGEQALLRAERLDPEYAPIYREQARCDLIAGAHEPSAEGRQEKQRKALAAAERALALDPDDLDAVTLTADILERVGRSDEARRMLVALTVRHPGQPEAFRALYAFGRAHHDEALLRRAGRRLRDLGERVELVASLSPLAEIDEALGRDDLVGARRAAHHARLPLAEVALRAAALGRIAAARSQAEVLVGADPTDSSARIALSVAADLAGDTSALSGALRNIPKALTPPSALARLLFAELLDRRVGPGAAREFLGAVPGEATPGDALLEQVTRRVRERLGQVGR